VLLKKKSIILFAPGVHNGGGLELILGLIKNLSNSIIFADKRIKKINYKKNLKITVVNTILGRLIAEFELFKINKKNKKITIFCFNGLPPFFCKKSPNIVVFLQNSLHFEKINFFEYPLKTAFRLFVERLILDMLIYKVGTFIVQTSAMKEILLKKLLKKNREKLHKIKVLPFISAEEKISFIKQKKKWDFIYVADGMAHKNHKRLLEAWVILAKKKITPLLALTIENKYQSTIDFIKKCKKFNNLRIVNLGKISKKNLINQYQSSSALIFPSYKESFGLPLVEASFFNLPILASELDYVRDVCRPKHTFDPYSSRSIARAVERFLNINSQIDSINTPKIFINKLLKKN
jgi:hypothetical protein